LISVFDEEKKPEAKRLTSDSLSAFSREAPPCVRADRQVGPTPKRYLRPFGSALVPA
jgi:hypothetical protein